METWKVWQFLAVIFLRFLCKYPIETLLLMDKDFFDTSILFVNKSSEQIMGYFNLLITACVLFYRKCINPLGTLVT